MASSFEVEHNFLLWNFQHRNMWFKVSPNGLLTVLILSKFKVSICPAPTYGTFHVNLILTDYLQWVATPLMMHYRLKPWKFINCLISMIFWSQYVRIFIIFPVFVAVRVHEFVPVRIFILFVTFRYFFSIVDFV